MLSFKSRVKPTSSSTNKIRFFFMFNRFQNYRRPRSAPRPSAQFDQSAVHIHNLLADRQTKPGPDSIWFRREKRLEHALRFFFRNPDPGVFDLDRHEAFPWLKLVQHIRSRI